MAATWKRAGAALVAFVASAAILSAAKPAQATTAGCAPDVGKRVPIVLVHGFWGHPSTWTSGSPSMVDVLSRVPGVYVDPNESLFDYSSSRCFLRQ